MVLQINWTISISADEFCLFDVLGSQSLLDLIVHVFDWVVASNFDDFVLRVKVTDHWHASLFEGAESLLDGLDVVIGSAGSLTTL